MVDSKGGQGTMIGSTGLCERRKMQIDWQNTIEEILANKISCLRCGSLVSEVMVGYLRSAEASRYAPLCQGCNPREDCDARKLVIVCEACGGELRLRGRKVDHEGMMVALLDEHLVNVLALRRGPEAAGRQPLGQMVVRFFLFPGHGTRKLDALPG